MADDDLVMPLYLLFSNCPISPLFLCPCVSVCHFSLAVFYIFFSDSPLFKCFLSLLYLCFVVATMFSKIIILYKKTLLCKKKKKIIIVKIVLSLLIRICLYLPIQIPFIFSSSFMFLCLKYPFLCCKFVTKLK